MSLEEYLAENRAMMLLPRTLTHSKRPRSFSPHSVRWLTNQHLKSIRVLAQLRLSRHFRAHDLATIKNLRGSQSDRRALVLGNGPSRDNLCMDCLKAFSTNGNHIIAVNEFLHGDLLRRVPPQVVVVSDPSTLRGETFGDDGERQDEFDFLRDNSQILLSVPLEQKRQYEKLGLPNAIVPFVDTEARYSWRGERRGIDLTKPRSYVSATLYKALAVAVWLGYEHVFVLGMDNTYPRDLFVDSNNHVLRRTRHASDDQHWCQDLSQFYGRVEDCLYEVNLLFHDIHKFASPNITNLDPYSLTDAFTKSQTFAASNGLLFGSDVCSHLPC